MGLPRRRNPRVRVQNAVRGSLHGPDGSGPPSSHIPEAGARARACARACARAGARACAVAAELGRTMPTVGRRTLLSVTGAEAGPRAGDEICQERADASVDDI